jgi:hypothetical protein
MIINAQRKEEEGGKLNDIRVSQFEILQFVVKNEKKSVLTDLLLPRPVIDSKSIGYKPGPLYLSS